MARPDLAGRIAQAETDFILLGPTRTYMELYRKYCSQTGKRRPPTRRMPTLIEWSHRYGWVEKAAVYDKEMRDIQYAEDRERAITEAREAREHRLNVARFLRRKAMEALENLDPMVLARRPGDLINMLALASAEERKDAPVEETAKGRAGRGGQLEDNLAQEIADRTIIILPANDRDKPALDA